jgi:GNAT superfamily N-acetyltransferase
MNAAKNSRKNKKNRNNTRRNNNRARLLKIPDSFEFSDGIHFISKRTGYDFLYWITVPEQINILKHYCDSAGLQRYFEDSVNKIVQPEYVFQIAVKDKYIEGFSILHMRKSRMEILEICTGVKRGGVGKRMIEACVAFGRDNGIVTIEVEAVASAIDFYTKLGFKDIFKENGGETCVSTRRELRRYTEWAESFRSRMGNSHEYFIDIYKTLQKKQSEYRKQESEVEFARMDMKKWAGKYKLKQDKGANTETLEAAKADMDGAKEDYEQELAKFQAIQGEFESARAEWNAIVEQLKSHGMTERELLNPPHPRNCNMAFEIK